MTFSSIWMTPVLAIMLTGLVYGEEAKPMPRTYHVSDMFGDDQRSGLDKASALRTIGAASRVMRAGDTCVVFSGTYRETLRPCAQGTPTAPITFKAAPHERVVITGLDPVTQWKECGKNTFRAPLGWQTTAQIQVFQNGKVLTEARWPNRMGDEFFHIEGATAETEGSSHDSIQCKIFPSIWGEHDLKDATIWCMAMYRWSSWTAPVISYQKESQRIIFKVHDTWWVKANHNPGKLPAYGESHPAEFIVSNAKILLDYPGEWFHDKHNSSLDLIVEDGIDPNQTTIEAQKRELAIDLTDCKHVNVDGFAIIGASASMKNSESCTMTRVKAEYICYTRGGFTEMNIPESGGLTVSGRNNTISHCTITKSSGSGITVSGSNNVIFNNFINATNSIGAYCVALNVNGDNHDIMYNTIANSGRDGLWIKGRRHRVQHNDISEAGKICHDTGAIYGGGNDGQDTDISFNWIHDVHTDLGSGIYLDNYSSNYNIHHNIVWNVPHASLKLNQPNNYMMASHNTLYGIFVSDYTVWDGPKLTFGSLFSDNIMGGEPVIKPSFAMKNNHRHSIRPARTSFHPNEITFSSANVGAHGSGQTPWTAGHNFENPPSYDPKRDDLGYQRNYIQNGSFEIKGGGTGINGWSTLSGQADLQLFEGWVDPHANIKNSVYDHSLTLSGDTQSRVKQLVQGLQEGHRFVFAGYAKNDSAQDIEFLVRGPHNEIASSRYSLADSGVWRHIEVHFTVPFDSPLIMIEIAKIGSGVAYIDNVGVSPVLDP